MLVLATSNFESYSTVVILRSLAYSRNLIVALPTVISNWVVKTFGIVRSSLIIKDMDSASLDLVDASIASCTIVASFAVTVACSTFVNQLSSGTKLKPSLQKLIHVLDLISLFCSHIQKTFWELVVSQQISLLMKFRYR